jgi:hypothetical protein
MRALIHNTVKTETSSYTFPTREQAEAFYMTLKLERRPDREPSAAELAAPPQRVRRPSAAAH